MQHDDRHQGWDEDASALFLSVGDLFTPARQEMEQVFVDLVPAERDEEFVAVDIGTGQGWLSAAVLRHFPASRVLALDGSPVMLEHARAQLADVADRVRFETFRLEDPAWPSGLGHDVRCFMSSLVIHHLDGPGKRALFERLYRQLQPGGALLIADLVAPTSAVGRRYLARAWDEVVKQQSLARTGSLQAYELFVAEQWNYYAFPDDPIDKPSSLVEQLRWLEEVGFVGIDAFWARAGHAIFGGFKSAR